MFGVVVYWFVTGMCLRVSAAGAGVSSVVRVLPQRRASFTALHSAVSAGAGVELPVGDGGTRSTLQRLHRGASARHLQPGECPDQLTHASHDRHGI